MKINMIKNPGGALIPATDIDSESMKKFRNGEFYEIDIKLGRNPQFLKKVMCFFKFCQDNYDSTKVMEHGTERAQFDRFRKDLTILAGYYEQTERLNGEVRTEAKSLSFASMKEDEFHDCYSALISAAMKHVFHAMDDQQVYAKLIGFF